MAWFKVDDGFWCHPKVLILPAEAVALWVRAGSYCAAQLLDGRVPSATLSLFGADADRAAQLLVEGGLWSQVEDGYQFHDWAEYQPTRASVESRREYERDKKRAQRRNVAGQYVGPDGGPAHLSPDVSPGDNVGDSLGESTQPVPSRPVPSRPDPYLGDIQDEKTRETRLPKTWAPTAEHFTRCQETALDLVIQAEKFKAHAAEKGRTAKNWNAAFTRWLINAKEYADRDTRRAPPPRTSSTDERVAGWLALGDQLTSPQGEPDWKGLTGS